MANITGKLTPAFQQYLSIKEDHPDALLFYRMGDFYELFFEDAEIAAKELSIALTARNPNAETKIPMCGMPYHAVDGYLAKLLSRNYKVAICDQIEDPKQAKGLVKRAVTKILTPGTVVEDENLHAKIHNYIAALYYDSKAGAGGVAWADFSTGSWSGLQSKNESELWQWAVKFGPRELLLPQGTKVPKEFADLADVVTPLPGGAYFDARSAGERILRIQKVPDLESLGLADSPQLARACGALLAYLEQTQKTTLDHLWEFQSHNPGKHLALDEMTEKNLEIFRRLDGKTGTGTLWKTIDATVTPMGGRLLEDRLRNPWRDLGPIVQTQDAVAFFHDHDTARSDIRAGLDTVYDLERLSTRITLNRAAPKDFIALRTSLQTLPGLCENLKSHLKHAVNASESFTVPTQLNQALNKWDSMEDVCELLDRALVDSPPQLITEGGLFKFGYHAELDEFIGLTEHGEGKLNELLELERERNELPKLKMGYNKVFGYYLEISKAYRGNIPEHFIRKQTLVNSERYITPELKEMEDKLLSASEKRKTLEYNLFQELRQQMAELRHRFIYMGACLAELDYRQGLAEAARRNEWTRPELTDKGIGCTIIGGRHPVVEAGVGIGNYVPGDLRIDEGKRILLITGPNMAGKSTVLRMAAILTLLAQIGSYVPAKKAELALADRIFSRVGASDNLAAGQSTFMVEMMETARILRQATSRSLVILDEIGRGTSTFDGLALAWAVVEELSKRGRRGIRTLFATHYHELTSLEGRIKGLKNLNIAVKEWKGDIVFLRKLVPGPADKSYGIEVANLAGVPRRVVVRAREILADLEEKSRKEGHERRLVSMGQDLLPGLVSSAPPPPPAEHPVIEQLRRMDLDAMTPMEALKVLHEWRKEVKDN